MFTNLLDRSITLSDGTADTLSAVFTDEGDLWIRTTNGRVVSLTPEQVETLRAFLAPPATDLDTVIDEADAMGLLTPTIDERVATWLAKLDEISPEGYAFTRDIPGKRFVRIVMAINGKHNSVHAFYDINTGDVYKAAGWKAPAKHVRFNLLDDASFNRMIEVADWSGGYLYIR